MKRATPKQMIFRTFTFSEFVQHGRDNGANIVNDIPWSWEFEGFNVSHESDTRYLISGYVPVNEGAVHITASFCPWQTLVLIPRGKLDVIDTSVFDAFYERLTT